MKNAIKFIVFVGAAILVLAVFQPDSYQVKRTIVIDGTSREAFYLISDLKQWTKWSPWYERDAQMKLTYSSSTTEVGDYATWESSSEGSGKQVISDYERNRSLRLDLEFYKPFTGTARTQFILDDLGSGQTKIVWIMYGKNSTLLEKIFYLFLNFDKMIGQDYERGLANIKSLIESDDFQLDENEEDVEADAETEEILSESEESSG